MPTTKVSVSKAFDADEHAHNLSAWNQSYDQLSSGMFKGLITELWTEKAQVFLESTNRQLRQSCSAWPDSLWFGIPVPDSAPAAMDCHVIPSTALAIRQGGEHFELRTPDDFDIFGVVVNQGAFVRFAREVDQLDDEHLLKLLACSNGVVDLSRRTKAQLCFRIGNVLRRAQCLGKLQQHGHTNNQLRASSQQIEDAIIGTLVGVLTESVLKDDSSGLSARKLQTRFSRWKMVQSIREYINDSSERDITIPLLCKTFHVSRRSLQYCFEDITGVSPTVFLRQIRLNGARRSLRLVSAHETSVANIATEWGFNHLGEFARDYRHLFGELPSETLRH